MYRPIFSSLVVLTLAVTFANALTNPPQRFSRQHSELPVYDVYRIQEKRRIDDQQQQQQQPVLDQPPEEDDNTTLLQTRLAKVSVLRDEHPFSQSKRNAQGFMTEALKFIQANQVVFYVACSCVLIGVALLFTLVTVYGGCGSARNSMGSIRARGEAHPLLGSSRNLFAKSGLNDSDEMSTCVGDEELDTRAHIMSTPEVSPTAQCSGGTNHDRSKWLAHGGHSEVFQVVSLLKRTILKIVPVMKAFTRDEVETLTLGIEASL
ncbi:hypothetical protein IscW_ISCW020741 [Ixodes scapularis]|uniref:Uncharacterized protein n=1 Tax=Ixodes scapularis TaxID=6945 RepID=B7Q0V1_IXOSC|nr:hypothetical protein IscW_ISCW020741 [Ixodes scapularis]|eukprot:XP_002408350.1 hypothetical protein IscW_ISCW020741 [Ixodes scapularis]